MITAYAVLAGLILTLLVIMAVGCWIFKRAYKVCEIYSRGWTWVEVKTLHGTKASGWCGITQLRSLDSSAMIDRPFLKVKVNAGIMNLSPTELDTIKEVTGIFKVAIRSRNNVI